MNFTPALLPSIIEAIDEAIQKNAEEVTALDQAIGDGDHVTNLQRGIHALMDQRNELSKLDWVSAWQKIGMTLMSTVGGASGSLFGTLFIAMSKSGREQILNLASFAAIFTQAVESVKLRGKVTVGEKTMIDVLEPVARCLEKAAINAIELTELLEKIVQVAVAGVESTRDMLATKGRASFLGERTIGHIDAGARTTQLMICAVMSVLVKQSASPS
ncbi:MAG: dihydroxyacetone kinase subunit DhaL [Methylovulum sp.]